MIKKISRFIMVLVASFGICIFGYLLLAIFLDEKTIDAFFPYLLFASLILGYYLLKIRFSRADSKLIPVELVNTVKQTAEPGFWKPAGVLEIHKQTFFIARPKSTVGITLIAFLMAMLTYFIGAFLGYDKTWKLAVKSSSWDLVVFCVTWLILHYLAHKDEEVNQVTTNTSTNTSQYMGKLLKDFLPVLLSVWFSMLTFTGFLVWGMSGGLPEFRNKLIGPLIGLILVLMFGFKSLNMFSRVLLYVLLALCQLVFFIF